MFVEVPPVRIDEAAAGLALAATDGSYPTTASLIEDAGSAVRFLDRDWSGVELMPERELTALRDRVAPAGSGRYRALIATHQQAGALGGLCWTRTIPKGNFLPTDVSGGFPSCLGCLMGGFHRLRRRPGLYLVQADPLWPGDPLPVPPHSS
ncbi:MAG: hypothetical protein ACYCYK_00465 [Candidatus Dormibacteria bacterium]